MQASTGGAVGTAVASFSIQWPASAGSGLAPETGVPLGHPLRQCGPGASVSYRARYQGVRSGFSADCGLPRDPPAARVTGSRIHAESCRRRRAIASRAKRDSAALAAGMLA